MRMMLGMDKNFLDLETGKLDRMRGLVAFVIADVNGTFVIVNGAEGQVLLTVHAFQIPSRHWRSGILSCCMYMEHFQESL